MINIFSTSLTSAYKKRPKFFLFFGLTMLTFLAYLNRFIQDDAFISFRYAANFAEGHGLVWNDGERIEGYTNFLWTLILAIPAYLHIDPIKFSWFVGLAIFPLSLLLVYKLSAQIFDSEPMGMLAASLVGVNYSYNSYATGGLETALQSLLFLIIAYLFFNGIFKDRATTPYLLLISTASAAALLTRLDSFLFILPIYLFSFRKLFLNRSSFSRFSLNALLLTVPLFSLVGSWVIWKLSFYGTLLPNTYYAKLLPLNISLRHGFVYLFLFLLTYLLFPILLIALARIKLFVRKAPFPILFFSIVIFLWVAYIAKVGGDFMEFRFMVPVIPFLLILCLWIVMVLVKRSTWQAGLIALIIFGSLIHPFLLTAANRSVNVLGISLVAGNSTVKGKNPNLLGVDTTTGLNNHVTNNRLKEIGIALGESFDHSPDIVTAITAAGAVPYYSNLRTIDMLGLSDQWVSRNGIYYIPKFGHARLATLEYLQRRNVNLLIGNPGFRQVDDKRIEYSCEELNHLRVPCDDIPKNSHIIEVPIDADKIVAILYLTPSKLVDEVIATKHFKTYPVTNT